MIQNFHYTVPLGEDDPDATTALLQAKLELVAQRNPRLRGVRVEASEGVLSLWLRCAGSDRWCISRDSRRIAATMMRRAKLDWRQGVLESVETEPNGHNLTKETGRNPGHTPRGTKKSPWDHVEWQGDPLGS